MKRVPTTTCMSFCIYPPPPYTREPNEYFAPAITLDKALNL